MDKIIPRKPKLYALLVGINEYNENILLAGKKVKFPKLYGCVSDAEKIRKYLKAESSFETSIKLLADHNATKEEIVRLFEDHLGKAGKEDTVLFYFSGHGTQEFADKAIFKSETDNRLESIACYFSKSSDDFLLADKELRWLISKLSQKRSHIVTIFDCCHSGDNTRNGYLLKESFANVIEKRGAFVFPQRDWNNFIFSKEIDKNNFLQLSDTELLPEGKHYNLSACESDESAVEISGEAVFTRALLNVLNTSRGDITYYSLNSRIRQYMRNVYEQKPKIYVANEDRTDLFCNFLNKPFDRSKNVFGELTFNENSGWQLNLGAIHGINKKIGPFKIFDPDDLSLKLSGTIESINVDSSEVSIKGDPDRHKVYSVNIEGITGEKLRIHFATDNGELADKARIFDILSKDPKEFIIPEDDEKRAQYVLRFLNGKYYLTYPFDTYRPLASPVLETDKKLAVKVSSIINHIASWEFLKNLSNGKENIIPETDLKVEIAIGNSPASYQIIKNGTSVDIDYNLKDGKWSSSISVRLTNNSKRNLYCSVLYLQSNFASYSRYLNPPVKMLIPGEIVELKYKDDPVLNIGLDKVMKWYNWKEQRDFLKFIISTENFDVSLLDFDQLPEPDIPVINRRIENEYTNEQMDFNNGKGWSTKQIEIVLKNPEHNTISEDDLKAFLDDQKTSDFALGLYFNAELDGFESTYSLKTEIKIKNEIKRGLISDKIIDIANWWSRRRRNNFYKQAVSRFPDRIKIVSEGDSWFQHPLVLDIIDHLHRVYNIYCVGAAGDTLRNYFSAEKNNGEYFLNALDEKDPEFFLISGGGNDILGSQFRNYLVDNPNNDLPEGVNPKRFLKEELFDEINSLMDIYKTAFINLKTHKPGIHVIVHGYDYPIKLNDSKKGWLGRYMIDKGIKREGDRQAIIHLIMDTFNQHLFDLSKNFDNVTYINLRGMIRFNTKEGVDQWYDEIHPNADGFQQIAMKFIQTIDGVVQKNINHKKTLTHANN